MLPGKRPNGTINSSFNINESEPSGNHKGNGEGMTGNPGKTTSVAVHGGPSSHNHFPIGLDGAPTAEVVAEMPHFLNTCGLCKHHLLPGHAIYMYRWYADTVPIRVFRNYERQGIVYPNQQGMKVYSTLWNADDWATQGGRVKTDWKKAPFTAQYCGFEARACKWQGMASIYECPYPNKANWWTSPSYKQLSLENQGKMKWVRDNYMIYDYCKDFKRFNGQIPQECYKPQF